MKKIATITMLAAGLAAAPAFAQSWYAGAGAGRGNLNMSGQDLTGLTNASVNDTDTTYFARIGIAESELKANANAVLVTANSSDRQSEATYGLGARIHITNNLSLFGEWMKNDKIQVDSYLGGIDFRF